MKDQHGDRSDESPRTDLGLANKQQGIQSAMAAMECGSWLQKYFGAGCAPAPTCCNHENFVNSYIIQYICYIKMMLAHTNMVCVCVSNTYIYGTDWCVLMW